MKKMTHYQFSKLFKTKPRNGGYDCYGTWNCDDISFWSDTEENARIEAYSGLIRLGYLLTEQENTNRNTALAEYAEKSKPMRTQPENVFGRMGDIFKR